MVLLKTSLCIIAWATYLTDVQATLTIPENQDSQDDIFKFKTVVIMFCEAMNSALQEEGKSPPSEMNKILPQLYDFTPNYKNTVNTEDFNKILELANNSLRNYNTIFLDKHRRYLFKAHYFRLLQWLKYNLRYKNMANEFIESSIDDIIKERDDDTQPKNFLTMIFPRWKIRDECLGITTLDKLKQHGRDMDTIVDFCHQLVQNEGDIDKIQSSILQFEFTGNEQDDNQTCKDTRHYVENFLKTVVEEPVGFMKVFKRTPSEVHLLLNEALRKKCNLKYKRAEVEKTFLSEISGQPSAQYLRNAITLYNHAVEKILLPGVQNFEQITHILELETTTLSFLSHYIIKGYDKQIKQLYNIVDEDTASQNGGSDNPASDSNQDNSQINRNEQTKTLSDSQKFCYSCLLSWAYKQVSEVRPDSLHIISVKAILENIWSSPRAGHVPDTFMFAEMKKSYKEITTFDALIEFCETGNLSPSSAATSILSTTTESAVIQPVTME